MVGGWKIATWVSVWTTLGCRSTISYMILLRSWRLSASITTAASNLPRTELAIFTPLICLDLTISSEVPGFIVIITKALMALRRRSLVEAKKITLLPRIELWMSQCGRCLGPFQPLCIRFH
jgi:hypothetical protein